MSVAKLKTEVTVDPLARGYSALSDLAVAESLNTADRQVNRDSMSASEVLNAIDKAEFNGKTPDQQRQVWDVLHMGSVNPFGLEADLFIDIFGGASTTITTLASLRTETVSRAREIGLGRVTEGAVNQARSIP